ncbi:ParB family protein [Paenarthrobacter ureafaciens]|uniref:ParB family protein n=1 Tax=Paenarthrobacter ureafaciens TaxID=37931 RepID=UPI0034639B19
MSRPTPRRSSLAGSSPVTPPTAAQAEPAPAPAVDTPAAAAPAPRAPKPATGKPAAGKKYPHKVSFYQDPDDTDRVRGAILYTMTTPEGNRNLSQFVNRAVMAEVERLEAKYNGGQPFPSVRAREIPQGGAAAARSED